MTLESAKGTIPKWSTYFLYAIGLTLAYILSGFFCIPYLSPPPDNYSLIWLPSGVGLLLFMVLGYSAIFWVLVGSFVINAFYSVIFYHQGTNTSLLFNSILYALIDVLEAFLAWKIVLTLEKKVKFPLITRNNQLISFFIWVWLIPSFIASICLIGVDMVRAEKMLAPSLILKTITYFTVGNTSGFLLVSPIYWAIKNRKYYPKSSSKNIISVIIIIVGIILISFFTKIPAFVFVIIPILAILAKYGNLFYSIITAFVICIMLSIGTSANFGYFALHMENDSSIEVVLFLVSLVFVLLFSTIAFAELNQHKNNLQILVDETINTLNLNEERYKVLAENVIDVIWVLSLTQKKFLYISPSVFQLRGFTVEEALTHRLEDSLTPESIKRIQERLATAIKDFQVNPNELKYYYDEFQQYHKDGSLIWIETVTHLIINKQGEMEVVGTSRNITKRKESESIQLATNQRLDALNATKDKFFSIIAHDLMSPFNTLIGFSDLLKKQSAKNDMEGVAKSAKFVHDAAEKTKALLKNLLEWSLTQMGKIRFRKETTDLPACIHEVMDLLKATAEQKGIELKLDIPNEGTIEADQYMLSSILRNLVANSIKYTYPGGFIEVSAELKEAGWIVQVKDNGTGMEAELTKQIFTVGAHKSEAGTQKESGTGLGLILCKEFVEMHGGNIWVDSKPGVGTVFGFSIPNV